MSESFDDFPDEPTDGGIEHEAWLAQAQHDAQINSNDLFEAISALEQIPHGARHALKLMDDGSAARPVLTAWRGNTALLQHTILRLKKSACSLSDAVGTLIVG